MHANGGSMCFILVYIHMFRSLYFGSYKAPRELLWIIGVVIYLAMMGTAFMGYVLPWGQMSYWGATVITSLFSAVPLIGDTIVTWLWGGFVIDNNTLTRFFVLALPPNIFSSPRSPRLRDESSFFCAPSEIPSTPYMRPFAWCWTKMGRRPRAC